MPDLGHQMTDDLLDTMEKKVARIYKQAAEETQKKLDDYLKRFAEKDARKRAKVAAGEITEREYKQWRTGQIMIGKRWEEMRDTLAQDYANADKIARSVIDGYKPEVYALNHNYATFQMEKDSLVDTSYTLYDRQTVERIMKDDPDLLPPPGERLKKDIAEGKEIAWQKGQIQSVTMQSILQGESIPKMAKRITNEMGERNFANATRYARTSMTGAQNAGRADAYKRAKGMGIEMTQMWVATLDGRTRHEHRQLDGQVAEVDEPFEIDGEKIRFPGDPQAPGYLIWNCRCTTIGQIKGFEHDPADLGLRRSEKLADMSYDEWKNEKLKKKKAGG